MKPFNYRPLTALIAFGAISGIGSNVGGGGAAYASDTPDVGVTKQAIDLGQLGSECGFACPGDKGADNKPVKTLAEGNVNISGIPSIDGFFASVVNFQVASKSVVSGIDAQLDGIRADFDLGDGDIGPLLDAKLKANLEAGFTLKVEPAQCKADIHAEFEAAAKCDVKATPGMLSVDCSGGCDVDVKAPMCEAEAQLRCTAQAPQVKCEGECTGSCDVELTAAAACSGTCRGDCSGSCDAYVKDSSGKAQCAGSCSGMCKGHCEAQVTADAQCKGTCSGECTVTKDPKAGCEGGLRAQCTKPMGTVKCTTKCDGGFEPPKVDAKCQAKVQADAKLNVQCTPPRVAFNYRIKAGLDAMARVRFENALSSLVKVRLPGLKAALSRSSIVADAGKDIINAAADGGSFKKAIADAKASGGVDVKFVFGLGCAAEQVDDVGTILKSSTDLLEGSIKSANSVSAALKI